MSQDDTSRALRTPFSDMADQLYPSDGTASQDQEVTNFASPEKSITASYVMKSGDTLWGMSQKTGIPLEDIQAANPHIDDPTRIPVGTALNLPLDKRSDGGAGQRDNDGNPAVSQKPAQPANPAEAHPQAAFADNQPVDEETRKKYRVEPGTTWRVVKAGQKVMAFWRAIENGEKPTREEALAIRGEIAKLSTTPDLSVRERQEVREFVKLYTSLAYNNGNIKSDEVMGDPLFIDAALGTPSGGGAARLPGAPLGAGMNMVRPGSPPLPGLNQQFGLSLPRSPLPRDLPAPPVKRRQ